MKKYIITFEQQLTEECDVTVEADSLEDAKTQARFILDGMHTDIDLDHEKWIPSESNRMICGVVDEAEDE